MSQSLIAAQGAQPPSVSEISSLCETCRSIDFKGYLIREEHESDSRLRKFDFGFLDQLIRRSPSCQLCSLIIETIGIAGYAKLLNDGKLAPMIYGKGRIKLSVDNDFVCGIYDERRTSIRTSFHRMVLKFEFEAYTHYIPPIKFHISTRQCDRPCFGRQVNPVIDVNLLKRWLRNCEVEHCKKCHAPRWLGDQTLSRFLRVIDVEKRCIIHAPSECRYIALSYVWGDHEGLNQRAWLNTKANQHRFEQQGGLGVEILPKTISDAMELVSIMGECYLWVDALCIVQDDDSEVGELVAQMDMVYAGALFTIVAASGANADTGLPGLRAGTRSALQGSIRIDDQYSLTRIVSQDENTNIAQSTWNSRAWTFQEKLLSRRVLIFTPEQVFWNCESAVYCEEISLEFDQKNLDLCHLKLDCYTWWDFKVEKFSRESLDYYVTQYSTRDFSYQSDALAAFSGILRRMEYISGEHFYWGLPHTRFDLALHWQGGDERREASCRTIAEDRSVHQVLFPSWAWVGWKSFSKRYPRYKKRFHTRNIDGTSQSELQFYKVGIQ